MDWISVESEEQVEELVTLSGSSEIRGIMLFKHSPRCSISKLAKTRLESGWSFSNREVPAYLIDVVKFRNLSLMIAERLGVRHESPQMILLKSGKSVFDSSHISISAKKAEKIFQE